VKKIDPKIKVIIIDDHPLLRIGIKKVLEINKDIIILADTGDANEAMKIAQKLSPDIAIIDISLSGEMNGFDLIRKFKAELPHIKILILSMYDEKIYAEKSLKAGARGYITKKVAPEKIIDSIRAVHKGELYLDNYISRKLLDKIINSSKNTSENPIDILSNREFSIFKLIGEGLKTSEIANKLDISKNTVESHKNNIKDKLGIATSTELIKNAIHWILYQK